MGLSQRKSTREFKLDAIERLESGASVAAVARALEVSPDLLQRWRQEFRKWPGAAFAGAGKRRQDPDRVAQLERKIGQQTLEIDFLKGCLQRIEQHNEMLSRADVGTLRTLALEERAQSYQTVQQEQATRELDSAKQRDAYRGYKPLPPEIDKAAIKQATGDTLKHWMRLYGSFQITSRVRGEN